MSQKYGIFINVTAFASGKKNIKSPSFNGTFQNRPSKTAETNFSLARNYAMKNVYCVVLHNDKFMVLLKTMSSWSKTILI